ncbi:hypothetical protein LCGC14_1761820, partial [marine sediment metagenome]
KAAGELFQEAIGMIHIDYCPWCRSELYQREIPYISQKLNEEDPSFSGLIDPNASRIEQSEVVTVNDMAEESSDEPEAT